MSDEQMSERPTRWLPIGQTGWLVCVSSGRGSYMNPQFVIRGPKGESAAFGTRSDTERGEVLRRLADAARTLPEPDESR